MSVVQIFGHKKCPETRKAERWFKERRVRVQSVDLTEKGLSLGELRSVAKRVGGLQQLVDRGGRRYADRGLVHAAPSDARLEELLLADPLLLVTPIVRRAGEATLGYKPEVWASWT